MSREPPDVDPVAADGGRPPDSDTADGDATGDPTPGPAGEVPTVSRDVRLGEADAADFTAADTAPVADASVASLLATLDGGDAPARRRAALALAERDLPRRALDALSDPSDRVREWAAKLLGEVDGDDVRTALAEAAAADESDVVRDAAARALDGDGDAPAGSFDEVASAADGLDVLNRPPDR